MCVNLRRTGYYSHERIQGIERINHIDWFSVNWTRESLPTSRPRLIQLRISNHSGIERLSQRYRGDVSYPETLLAYSRLPRRVQLSIFSLRNEVQAHLKGTILSSLIVSDLTPHAYSIQRPIFTSHHSLLSYTPTPRRASERFILLSRGILSSFGNPLNLCLPAHTESHHSDTKLLCAGAAHPARPQQISESLLDRYVKAAASMPYMSCSVSTYHLEEGVHHTLTVDAQPWAINFHT